MTTSDIRITFPASFEATTLTVRPTSDKGRKWFQTQFGACSVSAEIYKSQGYAFEDRAIANGLRVEVAHGEGL
jgi:hypothetical protein